MVSLGRAFFWLVLGVSLRALAVPFSAALAPGAQAEAQQDWNAALAAYENVYDATRTDDGTRAYLWKKFAELRPKVPPNTDTNKANFWKVHAYVFRALDFSWKDNQGTDHRAKHRYRDDEIERLRKESPPLQIGYGSLHRAVCASTGNLK